MFENELCVRTSVLDRQDIERDEYTPRERERERERERDRQRGNVYHYIFEGMVK